MTEAARRNGETASESLPRRSGARGRRGLAVSTPASSEHLSEVAWGRASILRPRSVGRGSVRNVFSLRPALEQLTFVGSPGFARDDGREAVDDGGCPEGGRGPEDGRHLEAASENRREPEEAGRRQRMAGGPEPPRDGSDWGNPIGRSAVAGVTLRTGAPSSEHASRWM